MKTMNRTLRLAETTLWIADARRALMAGALLLPGIGWDTAWGGVQGQSRAAATTATAVPVVASSPGGQTSASNRSGSMTQATAQPGRMQGSAATSGGSGANMDALAPAERASLGVGIESFQIAPPLAITINRGLDGLNEEVIPSLTEPNVFRFDDILFLDDEKASCFVASVGLKSMVLEAPITDDSVHGYFGNEGKVFVDIALDASFDTTFFWDLEVADGFNACDIVGAIDNAADLIVGLFGGESPGSKTGDDISYEELTLTAAGLEAEVDLTLGLNGDVLKIESVNKLEAEIGSLTFDGTALAEGLAVLAQGAVTLAVGDVTDAVNAVINDELLPDQKGRLKKAVNKAIEQNLSVERSVAMGGFSATIEVTPSALKSSRSENTMTLEFDFGLVPTGTADPCGAGLTFSAATLGTPESTSSDFDIQLPHWILEKLFVEAGHQGLFCQSVMMPLSAVPWTIRPEGTLKVESARWTETVTPARGLPYSVVHHSGELVLIVPMVFEGDGLVYSGRATGELKVYFKPVIPDRDRSVFAMVTEIDFENVVGTLTLVRGGSVDMSDLVDTVLNAAADVLAAGIGSIPLVPKTTAFSEDLGIALNVVAINESYTTVGANIVKLPAVDETGGGLNFEPIPVGTPRYPKEDAVPDLNAGTRDRIWP